MFKPEADVSHVNGKTFIGAISEHERYNPGSIRTNERPFVQEQIQHIDEKSTDSRNIGNLIAERKSINALRTLNNPKDVYGGRVLVIILINVVNMHLLININLIEIM